MSNENTSVLLSICAVSGIVIVMVLLAALLLVRVLRMSVFGVARLLLNTITEPGQEDSTADVRAQSAPRSTPRDLRARAKAALDFDAAVARQGGNPAIRTTPGIPEPPPIPIQTVPTEAPIYHEPPAASRRRRRRDDGEDDDGLLGNLFDDDGDGLF